MFHEKCCEMSTLTVAVNNINKPKKGYEVVGELFAERWRKRKSKNKTYDYQNTRNRNERKRS
jgi:hypothetical protein